MAHNRLTLSTSGLAIYKQRAIQEAAQQQQIINDKLKKLSLPDTGYEFRELIGKGAYGRVYKSERKTTGTIVAVKVLETDRMDFDAKGPHKDTGMQDALKEINILQRLKQSKAINVNMFIEAFQVHSQLWIASEYCSGGSLTTLRRATANKLSERHIIAIARELGLGLRSVHSAGIVHRDIKCSNVMINEAGKLQIIDFGVSGILLSNLDEDKRKTVIGTPHWMPPELQQNTAEIAHGTEVDVWAYGITLYECAMGAPPHARTTNQRELRSRIRQLPAPRISEERFTPELADFIQYVLEPDPSKRPTMDQICQKEFLADSEDAYPTESLKELVETYYIWEVGGGQRASLFMQGGAAGPRPLSVRGEDEDEEWNFSTTAKFEQHQAPIVERMSMNPDFKFGSDLSDMLSNSPPTDYEDFEYNLQTATLNDPHGGDGKRPGSSKGKTKRSIDFKNEDRVARGARVMQGIFNEKASPYKLNLGLSSYLPLRSEQSGSYHQKEISVGSVSSTGAAPNINLDNIPKDKKKRDTMAWKWNEHGLGSGTEPPPNTTKRATMDWKWNDGFHETKQPPMPSTNLTSLFAAQLNVESSPIRPQLKHSVTEPIVPDRPESMTLDLDALMDDGSQTMKPQTYTQPWSEASGNSYATTLPTYDDTDADIGMTMRASHVPTGSGGSSHLAPSDAESTTAASSFPTFTPSHSRSSSALIMPPAINPEALKDGASLEVMLEAMEVQVNGWMRTLQSIDERIGIDSDSDSELDIEVGTDGEGDLYYARSSRQGSGNWDFGPESEADNAGDEESSHGDNLESTEEELGGSD